MKISIDEKTWHDPRFVHVCKLLGWEEQTVLGTLIMLKCRVYGHNTQLERQSVEVLTGLGRHAQRFVDALLEAGLLFETPDKHLVLEGAQRAMLLRKARVEAGRRGGSRRKQLPSRAKKSSAVTKASKAAKKPDEDMSLKMQSAAAWGAYATAYMQRWGSPPVRNAKVNRNVQDLVRRVGAQDAVLLLRWFVTKHNGEYYVRRTHQVGDCLKDAETLVTQMRANMPLTQTDVRQASQHNTVQAQLAGLRSGQLLR